MGCKIKRLTGSNNSMVAPVPPSVCLFWLPIAALARPAGVRRREGGAGPPSYSIRLGWLGVDVGAAPSGGGEGRCSESVRCLGPISLTASLDRAAAMETVDKGQLVLTLTLKGHVQNRTSKLNKPLHFAEYRVYIKDR